MYDSKLVTIYSLLNFDEKRQLRKWINSDFVNKNKAILKFFRFLDTRKSITPNTVTKAKAYEYLFPRAAYNDLKIRHLMWLTTEIVEDFIVYHNIDNILSLKQEILSQFYSRKDLYRYSIKEIEKGIDLLEDSPTKNAEHYNKLFNFYAGYFDISSRNVRTEDFKIDRVADSFTILTILETLKTSSRIVAIQKVGETRSMHKLLPAVLELLKDPAFHELPEVRIYYNIYKVAAEEDEKAFQQFMTDIKTNEKLFYIHDLNELYRLAINFCIKKSNQNNQYYTQQAFELYLYAVENKILIENNEISRFIFTNTVTLGIKLKEFQRIENFINSYSKFLNEEFRSNTIDFNTAKVLYAKNEPDKALKILLTNKFLDPIWNLNAKYLVLKILFESRNIQTFNFHLKAFKLYLKRKSNIGYHKVYFSNVIEAFNQLLKVFKDPKKNKNFKFGEDTPDIDWFNKALKEIKK